MKDTVGFVFLRYELKYRLNAAQYERMKAEMEKRLLPDEFGETTIQSLYFDTPDFRLIRNSLEKPIFKEKLRLRCYGLNDRDKDVYLEMKRKSEGVVYKRRISCKEGDTENLLSGNLPPSQIGRELSYFLRFYREVEPKMLILYDRVAFFDTQSDLRVTFDRNVRYRTKDLNFYTSLEGNPLLPKGEVLMELKTGSAIPLWLCRLLSEEQIQKTSFSKYGSAYEREFQKSKIIRSQNSCLSQSFKAVPSAQPAFSQLCSPPFSAE